MSTDKTPSIKSIKESCEYNEDKNGDIEISFSSVPGRGYGKSSIKHSRLKEYIQFLEEVNNDSSSLEQSDDMIDIMKKTVKTKDGIVSWKTSNGRGSKPTRVLKKDLSKFIKFIKDSDTQIKEYLEDEERDFISKAN